MKERELEFEMWGYHEYMRDLSLERSVMADPVLMFTELEPGQIPEEVLDSVEANGLAEQLSLDEWNFRNEESPRRVIPETVIPGYQTIAGQVRFHNERALNRGARGNLTESEWLMVLDVFERRCAYCGSDLTHHKFIPIEHVIPIKSKGSTEVGNVVPSCMTCNHTKLVRKVDKWLAGSPEKLSWLKEKLAETVRRKASAQV